jgi:hypothetical protein
VHVRDASLTNLVSEHQAKPIQPEPDSLVADVDPALDQEIFDVSKRQRKFDILTTTRRMTSGELLTYRNGLLMPRLTQPGTAPRICSDTAPPTEDPQRPHALRVRLQTLDGRA